MPFQTQVGYSWPPGNVGEFATQNPRRMAVEGPIGFRAGAGGLTIGAFAWLQDDGVTALNAPPASNASAVPTGFVHRAQQGLATQYMQGSTMTIPAGFPATLTTGADLFVVSKTEATRGQSVFASTTDGTISTGTGSAPSGTVATGFIVTRGAPAGSLLIISGAIAPITATESANTGGDE